ncbi:Nucleoside triphosphate pyrophosphohydrolase/pyrophosphatase MazG [Methylacidimicrobium sp. AP8]|uniref:nucleoside triphosphate pyrophosphohydrolase n=1 Tax=Methylacidimicrobium sp. AP8 TaxID=2730359 RepID=UPI0018C1C498|nr:nucleoside triphosphate pyrophosphohydrolase [Methylacidimicrobium sp. AP8]CAB4243337.1 Nucleoside triphosphate pyrophosphohydrolase/pyrophosphatase MazG [Methylacidimicrobium sp. AP8]
MSTSSDSVIHRLESIIARLRAPGGCPWDRAQTHQSIKGQLLEECFEVLEAIDRNEPEALREELGDLLLHVLFHSQMANERGSFSFHDVAQSLSEKLIRRHPHVFGDASAETAEEVIVHWERTKREEKPERKSVFDGIPLALPALLRAQKYQSKAAKLGLDWNDADGPRAKIAEELAELEDAVAGGDPKRIEEEIGDLLFTVVNLARHLRVSAECALSAAAGRFRSRVEFIEEKLRNLPPGNAPTSAELELLWQQSKEAAGGRGTLPDPS